jgi:drug/metabolite transporter (DMT)-like permease
VAPVTPVTSRIAPIDALLLLMAIIWGTNYSIVKWAFSEINPQAFNAVRMSIASLVFLTLIAGLRRIGSQTADRTVDRMDSVAGIFHSTAAITRNDWLGLAALGVVGHFLYQYFFINGLAMTSVANSSLMLAATPVVIALVTAVLGHDRVSALHWVGAALSMVGIYAVVGHGIRLESSSIRGDALMFGAVCCWATYTIGARPLMVRHSPVGVTGLSMAIGTVLYVLASLGPIRAVHWSSVGRGTWFAIVYSALFALCVSYTIWYAAVREIGSSRTSVYSNLVPVVAMATAVLFLGEPVSARKTFGAAAVLSGVALTRVGRRVLVIPAEE